MYDAENHDIEVDVYMKQGEVEDSQMLAEMVLKILNCVEIPQIVYPEKTSFSTGEVNYYTEPDLDGIFICLNKDGTLLEAEYFRFEDKSKPIEEIQERL